MKRTYYIRLVKGNTTPISLEFNENVRVRDITQIVRESICNSDNDVRCIYYKHSDDGAHMINVYVYFNSDFRLYGD